MEPTKYKNRYRIETTRLPGWDYGSNGYYFVTLCVHNRKRVFGFVDTGKMILSETGKIARQCWIEIPQHFPFVILDEFVIMPEHVHGIIVINKEFSREEKYDNDTKGNHFGPQSNNLASIIRGFKIGVTKWTKTNNIPFEWQAKYHDHIIRSEDELNRIRNYIINNPAKLAAKK